MIHTAKTVRILQAVAMTVGIALFLWSTGLPTLFRFAEASSITSASDTLSNSAPSASANHTFAFQVESIMAAGQTITLTFPVQFTIPSLWLEDFDLTASGTEQTIASSNGVNIWGVSTSSQTITFTSPSNVGQASDTPFVIEIGNHAAAGGSGDTQIVNPAATTSRTLAHDLSVTTNAKVGYSVTVEQTGELQSTTGATINGFIDGSNTNTPTAWVGPSAAIANPDTYGHWGLTSEDGTTTRSSQFTSNTWVSGSTTPIVIMGHTGPADGTTDGIGKTRIGYQVQISALQEAGDDYTTTLRYIVTPTF